jgi:cytochrome P450
VSTHALAGHSGDLAEPSGKPRLVNKVCHWPGGGRSFPDEAAGVHALLNTDPPEHTRLRPLVQKAFTPRRAGQLRPRTKEIAAGLLDELTARGDVVDLLGGYARPLPITVICELLGIPVADRGWIRVTVTDYGKGGEAALTATELLSAAYHLVMAGFDTTVNLIASGTLALLTHPGEMARLRQDPSLLPAAVEELLRFANPVNHVTARFTTEDLPIGDVVITASTTAWAPPWPAWRLRSPWGPCSPASRKYPSRSPHGNSAGVPSAS